MGKHVATPRKTRRIGSSGTLFLILVCLLSLAGFHFLSQTAHAATTCNVLTYGATGNGSTKDTTAIQKAINGCAGGGTVQFPAGRYLTAPLFLTSSVILDVESGATILGSTTTSDYTVQSGQRVATSTLSLINSDGVSNITIDGGGVIDGQGSGWWASGLAASSRPRLIELANGNGMTISNVTLQNAGAMHLFLKNTNSVVVDHVTISSPSTSPNTDGIDPAGDQHVLIENSAISVGDDNIAIKAQDVGTPSSDITITGCTFGTGHGVSIGNDLQAGVNTVTVENSSFSGTTNGIRIKSTRTTGGEIQGITYSNLTMTNVQYPIWFSGYYPNIPASQDAAQPITSTTPNYHDITINGLTAKGARAAGYIVGVTEKPLYNIHLQNVQISATTGLVVRNATVNVSNGTAMTVSSGSGYVIQAAGQVITSTSSTPTPTPTISPTLTPTPVTGGTACKVAYIVTSQWSGGFGGSIVITNTGTTTLNSWTLKFSFANGQTITQLWNGNYTQAGSAVTLTNLSYNGTLTPGATVNPGFNASWNGSNANPTAFTLNGIACSLG